MTEKTPKRRFAERFYNPITYLGVLIAILVFVLECFLFALDLLSHSGNVYLGLITYLILPAFLFFGIALIPAGYWWKSRRIKRGIKTPEFAALRLDLSLSTHRNALLVFIVGTSVLVLMSVIGAYKAFHYTESVAFCGTLCHSVMHPEYTRYLESPHGRVSCVDCHIGAGADWYVKSKMSGVRQIFKTAMNSYDRPIPTPVHNLRPAEETCKQCHWPGKFFGAIDFRRAYFIVGKDNERWNLRMMMNVGAGGDQAEGVHAHMSVEKQIFYAAEDEKRQKITWVRSVGKDGSEQIFVVPGSKFEKTPPPPELVREMDCIDCHNRPTHQFKPPVQLLNQAMQYGRLDPAIPDLKKAALEALSAKYSTTDEALKKISESLHAFYREEEEELYEKRKGEIERAVKEVQQIYSLNMFPAMKSRWDSFPDNIGHMFSPGCFRCHDGEHESASGAVITRDCKSCHLFVEQGKAGSEAKNIAGLDFEHPDGSEDWKDAACTECHTGGADY